MAIHIHFHDFEGTFEPWPVSYSASPHWFLMIYTSMYIYIYTHLHLLYTVQYTTKRQQYGSLTTKLSPTICLQIALFVAIRFMPRNHEKKNLEIFPFSQLTNSSRLQTSPKKLANQTSAPSSHRCVFSATKKHLLDFLAPHKVIVSLKHTSPPR